MFEAVKVLDVILELQSADYISLTTDGWSSKNSSHSLLSVTAHFVHNNSNKFVVLAAKPVKGPHNSGTFSQLLSDTLQEFGIPKNKVFLVVRDAAEVMAKTYSLVVHILYVVSILRDETGHYGVYF
uniref:DUF659 domain-containing protein n=1 Tax=Globodera pallida TaxID=36090 RepID=A0A183BX12_GLOPA